MASPGRISAAVRSRLERGPRSGALDSSCASLNSLQADDEPGGVAAPVYRDDHRTTSGRHRDRSRLEAGAIGNENPATELKHAPKLFTETCKIDWNQPVTTIYNLIRGLSPYPAAFTYLNEKMLKIYRSEKETGNTQGLQPGEFTTDHKTYLKFACANGYILVKELQLEGKKKMSVEEFLRGYRFE